MGNTVVFKPAKLGVLLLSPLLGAFQKNHPAQWGATQLSQPFKLANYNPTA